MKKAISIAMLLLMSQSIFAHVKLPRLFSDNMVLQRGKPIPIWGWAAAKEKITVQLKGQTKTTITSADGKWKIYLDPIAAGGPYKLKVQGTNIINFKNILIGDVWVCSGQSNMEMTIAGWGQINNYEEEIAAANYPMIRHFEVPRTVAASPQEDISAGEWKICNPDNAGSFTAAGYFFAREIFKETGVPIGLLNCSWGGTQVESWISREAFENSVEFKSMIAAMPTIDLENLAKSKMKLLKERVAKIQGEGEQTDAIIAGWKDVSFDDSHWPVMQAPMLWEQQSLRDFDGIVWYRKSITVSVTDIGKEAILELAMIDDADDTYVNGIKVGNTNSYNLKRKYIIPAGILKEGKNVIVIKVLDTGGGGGIWGDAADVKLTIAEKAISLAGDWKYQVAVISSAVAVAIGPNSYPILLSNSMIHPLISFAIKGVIWYQGEANTGRSYQYRKAFPLMIKDWRKNWGLGDFPFYFVQLASFNANNGNSQNGSGWAELREAQAMTLSLPNTGMAVTTDIGDAKDIHPKNKQDVGKRLAAIALNKDYLIKKEYSGPVYQYMKKSGNKIILTFTHAGSGLFAKNNNAFLGGFEIASADKKFYPATAIIKNGRVEVNRAGLNAPVAVRFGWADVTDENNLYNREGLPAVPFRTDKWKGLTENIHYQIGN